MDNQWKEEICWTCYFPEWFNATLESEGRIWGECRRHPPSATGNDLINSYPRITKDNKACSCWRSNENT